MVRKFPLLASDGAQIITLIGGDVGFREIALIFATAPSAGTVKIEERGIGTTAWETVNSANDVDITSGELTVYSSGAIAELRVTFSSLSGGASPTVWLSSQPTSMPLLRLMTDNGTGPNARLRVDVAQTGFFAGREFRTFKEWDTPTTLTYVIKVVAQTDLILFELEIDIEDGSCRIESITGGTEGGTFGESLPIIPTNAMLEKPQPPYETMIALTAGGTLTGGTALDVLRVKTSGNTNKASSVGASGGAERGVLAGTYYFRVTLAGAVGIFRARWEERPNGSQLP